jgi:methylthioribose-1-phosphate isomerase
MRLRQSEQQKLPRKKRRQKRAQSKSLQITIQKIQIHAQVAIVVAAAVAAVVANRRLMDRIQKAQKMNQMKSLAIQRKLQQMAQHIVAADAAAPLARESHRVK